MTDDDLFRIALGVCLTLILPVALYHRLRSQATGEPLDRRQEGWFILVALRLCGALAFLAVAAFLIDPSWLAWSAVPLPAAMRWVGVGLFVLCGVLVAWTFHHLGRNLTDTVVTRREHTLVTTGPYRWVRHPFYVAGLVGVVGVSLILANWFLLLVGGLAMALLVVRTAKEEELLLARFGDEYRRYAARTGRFFPRWPSLGDATKG